MPEVGDIKYPRDGQPNPRCHVLEHAHEHVRYGLGCRTLGLGNESAARVPPPVGLTFDQSQYVPCLEAEAKRGQRGRGYPPRAQPG